MWLRGGSVPQTAFDNRDRRIFACGTLPPEEHLSVGSKFLNCGRVQSTADIPTAFIQSVAEMRTNTVLAPATYFERRKNLAQYTRAISKEPP